MFKDEVNITEICSFYDWLVFFLAIAITFMAVFYGNKLKQKNNYNNKLIEHLLMGRQLTLPLFVATLTSSWYGGLWGITQIAFENGIYNLVTQGFFWYFAYIVFALCFAKKMHHSKALTFPNLVKKTYGNKSSTITSVLFFIKTLPISTAISIGIFIQLIIPINLTAAIGIGVFIVVMYSYIGGFRAIVFSDLIQFTLMCLGVFFVLAFSVFKFGGLSFLTNNLPKSYFTSTGNHSFSYSIVWLFIALSCTFINSTFYHRCFAAKSPKVVVRGILISTCIWFLFDICVTFGAMYAKAIIPNCNPQNAYLIYSLQILPFGLKGFLLASIVAIILSTLDSCLFLASNILFYDLNIIPSKHFNLKHIISLLITASLTVGIASFFDGKIELVWRLFRSYFSACFFIPFLWGFVFPKLRSDKHFYYTCAFCFIFVFSWDTFKLANITNITVDTFYIGHMVSLVTLICLNLYSHYKNIIILPFIQTKASS